MRWNESSLQWLWACGSPEWEGCLTYVPPKKASSAIVGSRSETKPRWCRVRANCLFVFRSSARPSSSSSSSSVSEEPSVVLVLERCHVHCEGIGHAHLAAGGHAFAVVFADDPEKKHLFVAPSQLSVKQWVSALQSASYHATRNRLIQLQIGIAERTGADPLRGTVFQNNPLYFPATARPAITSLEPVTSATGNNNGPSPKPRARKNKSTFQSHVVESWERVNNDDGGDNNNDDHAERKKAGKPTFKSHVPEETLVDLS